MKNYLIILFLIILIILTSLVKTSTRDLETKIFTNQEEIKLLSDEKDLILLEYNFLSSPERLYDFKKKFFKENLLSINLDKLIFLKDYE